MVKISDLKLNENNPRAITEEKLESLCKSIKDFPKMMEIRPIVVDENNVVIGGNMRYQALIKMGYEDIDEKWVKKIDELSEQQKREFIIKDNNQFGEWKWDVLTEDWDSKLLNEWGLRHVDIGKINELQEWNDNDMPEFRTQNKFLINIYFNSEEDRKKYAEEKDIIPTRKRDNQWIVRLDER